VPGRLLDLCRTTVNVIGGLTATTLIAGRKALRWR
jgi:hypothetical protein